MTKKWRVTAGTILDFFAPVPQVGGATMYATQGTGSVCLEDTEGARFYLTMQYVGKDLFGADGTPVEGDGVCAFTDLDGNALFGTIRLDAGGVNTERVNSILLTITSGSGRFANLRGTIPLSSHVSPSGSDTRYVGFIAGEGDLEAP